MRLLEQFDIVDLRPSLSNFVATDYTSNTYGSEQRTAADLVRTMSNEARAYKSIMIGPDTGINVAVGSIERNIFIENVANEAESAAIIARIAAVTSGHILASRDAVITARKTADEKRITENIKRVKILAIFAQTASERPSGLSTINTAYLQSVLDAETAEKAVETAEDAAETVDAMNQVSANLGSDDIRDFVPSFFAPPKLKSGLYSSNILEDDYDDWDEDEAYDRGDFVVSVVSHSVFRSLKDSNTNNNPDTEQIALNDPLQDNPDSLYWQRISATNLFRLFDKKPSVLTTNDDTIEVFLSCDSNNPGIGFFNLEAAEIEISVYVTDEDNCATCTYYRKINLVDNSGVFDWMSYYTYPITQFDSYLVLDLPILNKESLIKISINNLESSAKCGQIVIGEIKTVGFAEIKNTGFRGLDFSVVKIDEYGNLDTTVRSASKVTTIDIVAATNQMSDFDILMRAHRGGKSLIWIPDEKPEHAGFVYGFYRDYSIVYSTGGRSYINVEIQGVV